MKAIITGHKGYIGSKLFKKCQELGWQVIGVDLKEGNRDVNYISHYQDCLNLKPDVIFHMASVPAVQYSVEHPAETCYHNVLGTSNVLQFAKNNNVKRVIFSSSSAIYGNNGKPLSPYALQKAQSEMECKLYSELYGLDTVCLRYFNVYSEDQIPTTSYPTVISAWMKQIREKKECLIFGDGLNTRDYIHVNDIIDCNLYVSNYQKSFNGQFFDVGTGTNFSLNFIKDFILKKHNIKFVNKDFRKGDALISLAEIKYLNSIGWSAKIDFQKGLEICFSKENIK